MSIGIDHMKIQRGSLKEKVLQIYDKLFQGQDITQGRAGFWDDFFLLKTNPKCLIAHFEKLNIEDLKCLQPQLSRLFIQCLHTAQNDRHRIRIANAIQTMNALLMGIHRCKVAHDLAMPPSEFLLSSEHRAEFMKHYVSLCVELVREDMPERLRHLVFNSLHIFASVTFPVEENYFIGSLIEDRIYNLIHSTLTVAPLTYYHGLAACRLLGLLLQYNKSGNENPFDLWVCQTDDELLLNGISSTVAHNLSEFNTRYRQQQHSSGGIWSFFSSLVSGDMTSNVSLRPCDSLLLCVFGLAKCSSQFSTFLSYSNGHCANAKYFETILVPDPIIEHKLLKAVSTDSMVSYVPIPIVSPGKAVPVTESTDREVIDHKSDTKSLHSESHSSPERILHSNYLWRSPGVDFNRNIFGFDLDTINSPKEPRNLLADLLEYCSIVMQDVKTPESLNSCHLCFLIIWCITQNRLACSLLHDSQLTFQVRIHKSRSRKSVRANCDVTISRPMAVAILDLIVEFARGHLMKKLPHRLYSICLSICHNLICYERKHKIRLDFDWKQLWTAILYLLQFVLKLDSNSISSFTTLGLIDKALKLFNCFILHGDSFLQAADVYDNLYYELIRMHGLIDNLYEYSLQHSTSTCVDQKQIANSVLSQLGNLRLIVNHFNSKVTAFSTLNNVTSLTESQVLDVVRKNYDSLTLRFLEDLDFIEQCNYSEDANLFHDLVETIVKQMRKDCLDTSVHIQDFLHELSTIS